MAHELTAVDNLVLTKSSAWHGLGVVVPEAMTPREASQMVFPYTVVQRCVTYRDLDNQQVVAEGIKINLRYNDKDKSPESGHGQELGRVSDNYKVVQPLEMADFCEALSDVGGVKVETAGSIRSGRRLWFLLQGEAFNVAHGDTIMPYVLVSNGYDGTAAFRVTPTTVRVVCSNTLHAVIPRSDKGELIDGSVAIRHTANIMDRINEAKAALTQFSSAINETKAVMETLAKKEINSDEMKQFFMDCYQSQFQEIPVNPKTGFEERRVEKAKSAFNSFTKRFDEEKGMAGTTIWCAANAWSGLVQHDRKSGGQDDADRIEKRVENNLFGLSQERTQAAFQRAFRFALAK